MYSEGESSPAPVAVPDDVFIKEFMPVKDRAKKFYYTSMPFRFRHVNPYHPDVATFSHALVGRAKLVKVGGVYTTRPRRKHDAVYSVFKERVARMKLSEVHIMSVGEFINSRPARVRRLYQLAADSKQLESRGLRDMARLKGFLKSEKSTHSFPTVDGRKEKAGRPRGIQPRGPSFNLLLGPRTVPIERVVFHDLDAEFMPVWLGTHLRGVVKGLCPTDQALEMRRHWDYHGGDGHAAFMSIDMSSFDATVDDVDLLLDHFVSQLYFPGDKTLKRCHSMQFRNEMRAVLRDGVVKTKLGAMRMSGDMNTSLGNCIISFAMAWEIFAKHGCTMIVNGDDVGVFGPRRVLERLAGGVEADYLAYGKLAQCEPIVTVFELCEFCQTRPVCVAGTWTCTRHWDKAMDNDYAGFHKLGDWVYYLSHLHAVASCGMAVASGVPILQSLYSWGLRVGLKSKINHSDELRQTGLWRQAMAQGGWRRAQPVAHSTRASFHRAFGITPAMQVAIELELDRMPGPSVEEVELRRTHRPDNDNIYKSQFVASSIPLSLLQSW